MAHIVLSADNRPTLYQAPDAVALHLDKLALQFLDSIRRPGSPFLKQMKDGATGEPVLILCYNEEDFVAWLNRKKQTREMKVTAVAQSESFALPDAWRDYPYFNF